MKSAIGATPTGDRTVPCFGLLEWFRIGDHEKVEKTLADARRLGVNEIRTGLSWADSYLAEARDWYDWLMPRLAQEVNILPCLTYTPPSEGVVPKVSSPPKDYGRYAYFVETSIQRYGRYFDWVELWNEPNGIVDWDWRLDPEWNIFCDMVSVSARTARKLGKKVALGGMCPVDQNWLEMVCSRGTLENVDVVGVHGFPNTWEFDWVDWAENLHRVQQVLDRHAVKSSIWITEVGYSTWRHDEFTQVIHFENVMRSGVDRVYWYSLMDLDCERGHLEGFHQDKRHYHLGMKRSNGKPKLLFRILEKEGLEGINDWKRLIRRRIPDLYAMPMATGKGAEAGGGSFPLPIRSRPAVLITGGAGFLGSHLADRLLAAGENVFIFDNLSRPGAEENLRRLRSKHGSHFFAEPADIRDPFLIREAAKFSDRVYHFAAHSPCHDEEGNSVQSFEVNIQGTLNLLEALRAMAVPPPLFFASTGWIYREREDLEFNPQAQRYEPANQGVRNRGIDEKAPLEFSDPQSCSTGAADQYVLKYARSFGIPAAVFRLGCIYGAHQPLSGEPIGISRIVSSILNGEEMALCGDGAQVLDFLYIDDLVEAFVLAYEKREFVRGEAFNIGGGPSNAATAREIFNFTRDLHGGNPGVRFDRPWPVGKHYLVADTMKFRRMTGWRPSVDLREGMKRVYKTLTREVFASSAEIASEKGSDWTGERPL